MESTKLNQWRNTDVVIEWFKSIENKGEQTLRVQTLQNPYTVYPIMI